MPAGEPLGDSHADVCLDLLVDELHPRLRSQLRVSDTGHGLFGYSCGGLLALYAWLRGPPLVATVGAGTPGVGARESRVFDLIGTSPQRLEPGVDLPLLHVTGVRASFLSHLTECRSR